MEDEDAVGDQAGNGAPETFASLLHTGRVAGEATVEHLAELGIAAEIDYVPNLFVRLLSGGSYQVRVSVPRAELERARAELEHWAAAAQPNVSALAREVQRVLVVATLVAVAAGGVLAACGVPHALVLGTTLWFVWLGLWTLRSRRRRGAAGSAAGAARESATPDPRRAGR